MVSLRVAICAAALAGLSAASAQAADALAAPAGVNWSGIYGGLNGGYGWGSPGNIVLTNTPGTSVTTSGLNPTGAFGGGQIGINWQSGALVFGLETDLDASGIGDSFSRIIDGAGDNLAAHRNIDLFGSVRGRLGIAWDRLLIYGAAGLAYADVDNRLLVTNGGLSADLRRNGLEGGVTVGGGVEYALNSSWSLKAEYQYVSLGSDTLSAPVAPPNGIVVSSNKIENSFQAVLIGFNYKFGSSGH
jgi:outer membrane immunogenic protein